MAEPIHVGAAAVQETGTDQRKVKRLDVALEMTAAALDGMREAGQYQAAVWLCGHRLAWDDQEDPQLAEQQEYLQATFGFQALKELLPGDDTELIQATGSIGPRTQAALRRRLSVVKPWGERPLYLTIIKAAEELLRRAGAPQRKIIVITTGGNQQGYCRHKRSKDQVLAVLKERGVEVHFVAIDPAAAERVTMEGELREIANVTGGSYQMALTATQFGDHLKTLLVPAQHQQTAAGKPANPNSKLLGRVTYYGQPVRRADVTLEGIGTTRSDREGNFVVNNVPPGKYTLKVQGIAKNRIRDSSQEITVAAPPALPPQVEIKLP